MTKQEAAMILNRQKEDLLDSVEYLVREDDEEDTEFLHELEEQIEACRMGIEALGGLHEEA